MSKEEHKKDGEARHREERRHQREERHRQQYKSRDDIDSSKNKEAKIGYKSKEDVKSKEKRKEIDTKTNQANGESSKMRNETNWGSSTNISTTKEVKNDDTMPKYMPNIDTTLHTETDHSHNEIVEVPPPDSQAESSMKDFATFPENQIEVNDSKIHPTDIIQEKNIKFSEVKRTLRKSSKSTKNTKPPNVLVYADSLVTKENVKEVLSKILNREK